MAAFAGAKNDHSLDDLKAVETSADETRSHAEQGRPLGENEAASAHLVSQRVRSRKVVRQSRPAGTIRALHKSASLPILRRQADVAQDTKANKSDDDDEDRKTLSQQVADGKYGLIQKEIFNKALHRPGIISYEVNPEVPKDNVNNLGGLRPDDIWLAENHLLVLSGGGFEEKEPSTPVWPPIDNYNAPLRQVKIPSNPKVPPPFPVQLKEGGPIEFIRNENGTGGPPPLPPFFPPPFPPPGGGNSSDNITFFPYPPPNFSPGNFSPGNGPFLLPPPPFPFFPPPEGQNISLFLPPPGFIPGIPPGAAFLPPPENFTDQIDEDDPSLYYPPPYDFYYPKDNSSIVPPGPLVPGIVLPPPPNFFAPLSNTTNGSSKTTTSNSEGSGPQHFTKDKVATPTKKPVKTVTILTTTEAPGDYNLLTTPTPVYYTTDIPPTVGYTTTTDNTLEDVTQPAIQHALPPNAVVQEWVPIPAPRPFYITGPRKPLRKGTTTTTLPPDYNSVSPPAEYINGYLYNTPKTQQRFEEERWALPNKTINYEQELQYFKEITGNPKDYYDYYPGSNPLLNQYLTQSLLQKKVKPLAKGVGGAVSPIRGYTQFGRDGKGKSLKATYYFYEEPHIVQSHLSDADDIKYDDASYRTTTPAPPVQYYQPAARGSPQVNYGSLLRTTTAPNVKDADVSYYYPDSYVSVKQPQLSNENPVNYFQYSGDFKPSPIQIPTKVFKSNAAGQTVYEYSFTAPGYSGQPSKIGTPQKPAVPVEQTNVNPVVQSKPLQQYNSYEYQSTPVPQPVYNYNQPVYTTASPIKQQYFTPAGIPQYQGFTTDNEVNAYYTTPKPESNAPTQTENPYHAFFTPQDAGLIDDITKKYFTVFGQKVNQEPLTTPLPPEDVGRKAQYPQSTLRLIDQNQKLRFPEQRYPGYYTTPATPYRQKQFGYSRPAKPLYSYSYGGDANRKPISLQSDILVNYRQPLPPINPDAEFIDPNTPNIAKPPGKQQSLISYSLPGNGGHFYFLPPQAAPQSDNYDRYDNDGGYVYSSPTDTNQYYKRNAKASPQRIQQ